MSEGTVIAVIGVIGGLVTMLGGTAWLNRKNLARLTQAQSTEVDAKAVEITDRIAREWIKTLDTRIRDIETSLEREKKVRRAAIAFIERLLDWIGDRHPEKPEDLPAIPADIIEYIEN